MTLAGEIALAWDRLSGAEHRRQKAAKTAFRAALAALRPGDIAVDLGANAGEFTVQMADTGATVWAFEPDPHAFGLLKLAIGARTNVHLVNAAAGDRAGTATLYRSTAFDREPDRRSKSSSLFAEKRNVDSRNAVEIEVKDFNAFLADLPGPVALLKIDIEGAEVPLMEALLASDQAARVGAVFVETHERGLPALAARTAALKARTAGMTRPQVNWDWH